MNARFSALVLLGVAFAGQAGAGERECAASAAEAARSAHQARLDVERARVQAEATASWETGVKPAAEACLVRVVAAERRACAARVEAFLISVDRSRARLPAGAESIPTECGPRSAAFPATAVPIEFPARSEAETLAKNLRKPVAVASGAPAPAAPVDARASFEAAAQAARLESIERLEALIGVTGVEGDPKAEMLLRLGDLYFAEGVYQADLEDRGCAANAPCAHPARITSAPWLEKASLIFKTILVDHPQFARADEATYLLGLAAARLGHDVESAELFARVVKLYPESRYVPDAYLALGDYYYATSNPYKALMAYQKAATFREHGRRAYALYRLGGCYEAVGEHALAVDALTKAVEAAGHAGQAEVAAAAGAELTKLAGAATP